MLVILGSMDDPTQVSAKPSGRHWGLQKWKGEHERRGAQIIAKDTKQFSFCIQNLMCFLVHSHSMTASQLHILEKNKELCGLKRAYFVHGQVIKKI